MEAVHAEVTSVRFTAKVVCAGWPGLAARLILAGDAEILDGVVEPPKRETGITGGPAKETTRLKRAPSLRTTSIELLAGGVIPPKQSVPCNPPQASRRVV